MLFLLYVSVMLVITFLRQEYVLLPELQSLDIVSEEARIEVLKQYQHMRWFSFLLVPVLLALRLSLVALCLFVGGFFFEEMSGKKYKEWWEVATVSQSVILLYSIILCVVSISLGTESTLSMSKYSSLLFLGGEDVEPWVRTPLAAVNLFEIMYWLLMAVLTRKLCGVEFRKSFKFVMSTYGVGYLFYIALLMFLILYLT